MINLHNEIMKIPSEASKHDYNTHYDLRIAYQTGHKDARHKAAELALRAEQRIAELEQELRQVKAFTVDKLTPHAQDLGAYETASEEFYFRMGEAEEALDEFKKLFGGISVIIF